MHVGRFLQRSARRYPRNPLWLTSDRTISYDEGATRVRRLSRSLLSLCKQGDRVALLTSHRFEGLEAHLAIIGAGMIAVPMNPRLHASEHEFILGHSGTVAIIFSADFSDHLAEIRSRLPNVRSWVVINGGHDGSLPYEQLVETAAGDMIEPIIQPEDSAWLFYTSGTTGRPKGAIQTHRVLITMIEQFLLAVAPNTVHTDVMLHAAPICHGSGSCLFPHVAVAAGNAFLKRFEPELFFDAVARFRVTATFLAPTMINRLTASEAVRRFDTSSLKNVIYGGAPMHLGVLRRALDTFGPVFAQIYGQGESPFTIASLSTDEHVAALKENRLNHLSSVGRVVPAVDVRILNDDDTPLPRGQFGEICVRGDLVMPGYWNDPGASANTLKGGWLHTGDVGYLDEEDYLFITDRKKDMIISGGANIYPREVEEVIANHTAVAEVAVIGVPDEEWGESVKAFVVLRAGKTAEADEIIEFCKDHIASYKKPKFVEFVADLPKNPTGKILKRELRTLKL